MLLWSKHDIIGIETEAVQIEWPQLVSRDPKESLISVAYSVQSSPTTLRVSATKRATFIGSEIPV